MPSSPSEYTPTTGEVREAFSEMSAWDMSADEADAAFDRWLAAHDREIAVKTLREAVAIIRQYAGTALNAAPAADIIAAIAAALSTERGEQ